MIAKQSYPPELEVALSDFRSAVQNLVAARAGILPEPAPIIYHYTNDVGLQGILQSGRLWLTDIFKLNDPSEVYHGFSRAIEILKNRVARGPVECKRFADDLAEFVERNGIEKFGHFFICSFSSCGDDLGQWRAYGDNGRGYALGFDTKRLEDAYTKSGTSLQILRHPS